MMRLLSSFRYLQKGYILQVICIGFSIGCLLSFSYISVYSSYKVSRNIEPVTDIPVTNKQTTKLTTITTKPTTTKSSIYSWFEPVNLLKLRQDLKAKGWTVPKGNLGNYIQKMKIESKIPTTTTIAPKDILAVSDRWKINHIGHFKKMGSVPMFNPPLPSVSQTRPAYCIKYCKSIEKAWSAFNKAKNLCKCGDSLTTAAIQMVATGGEVDYEDVYRVAKFTKDEVMTLDSIKRISAGCFERPAGFDTMFPDGVNDPNYNVAKCLLYCEKDWYPVAAWDGVTICQCGDFDENFPPNRMGIPVDDDLCDKTPCPSGPALCTSKYIRIMRTNVEDDRCDMKKFLPRGVGRKVALMSFPGSGNTWVRYLIESATGIYSGCVYTDIDLFRQGFIGEFLKWDTLQTSVIKTHRDPAKYVKEFDEAVFIIRNPFDAIMAEFNRIRGGHIGYAEEELFGTMEWVYFVSYKIPKWFNSIENWTIMDKILLVYFEEIVENPMREIRKIVQFLNYPVENLETRLACLETNLNGSFKRPKRKLSSDPFQQQSKDTVNNYIKAAREIISQRGLQPLPDYEK